MSTPTFLTPDRTLDLINPTQPPLYVIIRFSASIPDLPLDIFSPETTTSAGLKQLIRTRLPPNLSSHRLRLIYAGRGLEDATPLAASLKLPPSSSARSTPRPPEDDESTTTSKGKGKAPVRDPPRLYIHCSIGDIVLSPTDLAAEAAIASTLRQPQDSDSENQDAHNGSPSGSRRRNQGPAPSALDSGAATTTTPAPRGFDRLLAAGFTPAEVTALRSQFMAIQAVSRTPDTMPSGAELREMEDRWMDEGSSAVAAGGGVTGGGGGAGEGISFAEDDGGFGPGSRGAMDDMLWGAVMGFFWPVGCAMWLRREEGVWSWRKGFAVFVGVVVNVAFGAMRIMN
ncbi:DSC3 family protein [Aspergillus brunneoviolaceus CBS 621.78]|uniref:Membrane protein n=1 Tax=Aspergillus brunneoviolaceus CBS 621.78 TaxID=1450534 RepID=A0ACD1G281_9EURO|nr:membrane protein [Aspergillus brunneoviolaceus CBS 621.78]RAH43246.1 membrane protein [Aspergillus brunneoviolaceus CBS 621.78]